MPPRQAAIIKHGDVFLALGPLPKKQLTLLGDLERNMASPSTSRPFPGFDFLFEVTEPDSLRFFRANLLLAEDEFFVTRGDVSPNEPVTAHWYMGRGKPEDIVWTGHVATVLVSERIHSIFLEHGISGWSSYRVSLHGKNAEPISGYFGLVINGRCGAIDNSKSQQISKRFPAKNSKVWKGIFFDPSSWDGSDLFMPSGRNGWIFATNDVKQVIEKEKIKNIAFNPLGEVERLVI